MPWIQLETFYSLNTDTKTTWFLQKNWEMEKVLPMDVYPMQLLKACMVQDIERMEALGIYEVVPQDFALVDYSCTSKIEAQEIIKQGIELMIKEEG